ncbi:hypothetical protein A0H76_3063 [Hepatospora eriocheir]|uniref:Uncharacterized protein n=1 Tax=Hepatospora eriocheir TaxID=1081669 RepID=A0A1X0Q7C8_9MICR|nr:hypothetical protein A0H76_3063 [Hepatospora eriocheir]
MVVVLSILILLILDSTLSSLIGSNKSSPTSTSPKNSTVLLNS